MPPNTKFTQFIPKFHQKAIDLMSADPFKTSLYTNPT